MKNLCALVLLLTSTLSFAHDNCGALYVTWDSDGNSPFKDHAQCAGDLQAGKVGSSQVVEALTNEEAGGVGFSTFYCKGGVWIMEQDHFNSYENSTGYCAD